jgi:hypothetical protein
LADGLSLQGLQYDYQTPRTYSANLTFQYSLTHTLSAQGSYVYTSGKNLQTGVGTNNVSQLWPKGHTLSDSLASGNNEIPFPDFSRGSSYHTTVGESAYHGLQTKLEEQMSNGLTFLLAYTYSKTLSDAGDLLNGGSQGGYRAPDVPGLGPKFDWALANFDIRSVFHLSGGYELPFGKGKRYMNTGGVANAVLGGWATNFIVVMQGGQPINIGCPTSVTEGTGCNAIKVAGQDQKLGIRTKIDTNGTNLPYWFGNPGAFQQACPLGADPNSAPGCLPLTGSAILGDKPGQTKGPGFHNFDFSTFKAFKFSERFSAQFRAEFFNILNHPNFSAPGFGGNGVVSIGGSTDFTNVNNFGAIGSTRNAPNDPRQIQFAVKLYY